MIVSTTESANKPTPTQFTLAQADPSELDYWTLKDRVKQLEAAGKPVDEAKAGLAHKLSSPLSTLPIRRPWPPAS